MSYVLKHDETKKYVSRPNSYHSYTHDRACAREYTTKEAAEKERCVDCESIFYSFPETRVGP